MFVHCKYEKIFLLITFVSHSLPFTVYICQLNETNIRRYKTEAFVLTKGHLTLLNRNNLGMQLLIRHNCQIIDAHGLKMQGRGYMMFFAKIPRGVNAFRKNCYGGPPISGFIAFLLTSVLRFA